MREAPSTLELIDAVSEFLSREVLPELPGRLAFHARVAVNVLAIVRREMEFGPPADRAELQRLAALLGEPGDIAALNAALCRQIANGAVSADDPALVEHLWATTLDTVAIDQPAYATYRRLAADAARGPGDS